MQRWSAGLVLLFLAGSAFAFDTTRHPVRIAILRPVAHFDGDAESSIQNLVLRSLTARLRERGFDAFDAGMTYDDAAGREAVADYLVEIAGGEAFSDDYGGVGFGSRNADVMLEVVASRVAGQLRVYDGRTLDLLAREDISRRSSAILPTSIGLGGREYFAVIALPFVQWVQVRRVAHAAARDAAAAVTDTVRGQ